MRTIYAFAGKRGTGKSTASKVLVEMGFEDVKFADPLKNMLRAMYRTCGVDDETIERKIEGDLKEVPCEWLCGGTPRRAMQQLGTEWRDSLNPELDENGEPLSRPLWSEMFIKRVESGECGNNIVCSDFRFPHEADALRRVGAYTYRIDRPGSGEGEAGQHLSETIVDKIKVGAVLRNTGTVEDLREYVRGLVEANGIIASLKEDDFDDLWDAAVNRAGT